MLWMWSCVYLEKEVQVSADKSMGKAVKRRRALETVEDTLRRQAQNRTRMASMIASETHEQTLLRQEQDRICTASMRASETHEQTLRRQEQNETREQTTETRAG